MKILFNSLNLGLQQFELEEFIIIKQLQLTYNRLVDQPSMIVFKTTSLIYRNVWLSIM